MNEKRYYEIKREGNLWTVVRPSSPDIIRFQGEAEELEQFGVAIITRNNGKYTFYLPTLIFTLAPVDNINWKLVAVIENIQYYRYYNQTFLFQIDNQLMAVDWKGKYNIIEKWKESLPTKKVASGSWEINTSLPCRDNDFIISTADGDFLIRHTDFLRENNQNPSLKIIDLDKAEALPGVFCGFKVTTENGEYIYEKYYQENDARKYASIKAFEGNDYNTLFSAEKNHGYWGVDKLGNIEAMFIFQNHKTHAAYRLFFDKPLESIRFISSFEFSGVDIHIWKIKYAGSGEEKILFSNKHHTYLAEKNIFE